MVRRETILVELDELRALFRELALWDKIHERKFGSVESARSKTASKSFPNATSRHLKHYNAAGGQACTTHQIVDSDGNVLHWDESNIYFSDLIVAKAPGAHELCDQ